MFRRILAGGAFAVIIAVALIVYLITRNKPFSAASIPEAVPETAIIYAENIDFEFFINDILKENKIWNELSVFEPFHTYDSLVNVVLKDIHTIPTIYALLTQNKFSLSAHLLGKNKISLLIYFDIGKDVPPQDFEGDFLKLLGENTEINERKYEAVELKDISFNRNSPVKNLTYAIKDGLFITSVSSILVEDAIRTLNSGSGISNISSFNNLQPIAGKYVNANLYVNYSIIYKLSFPLLKNIESNNIKRIANLADWGEFDLDIKENSFVLNGMTNASDSLMDWLNLFNGQSPVKIEIMSVIPDNICQFSSIGIDNTELFKKQLLSHLQYQDQLQAYNSFEKRYEKISGISPMNDLLDLLSDEFAWFQLESEKGINEEVVIFEVRSNSESKESIRRWLSGFAREEGQKLEDFTHYFSIDKQSGFTIYEFPEPLYQGIFPGNFFKSFVAIYENYLIFSNSFEAISRTIYHNILHKTIVNESRYEDIGNLISTRGNLTCFIRPKLYIESNRNSIKKDYYQMLDNILPFLQKIPGIVIQFATEDEMFYSQVSGVYTAFIKDRPLTVWESLLDSMASIKPALVVNHNTSEKEIMVQDKAGNLYLINNTGRILWKIKLNGPIMSDILQVDYYNNGKLQYLFNTPSSIHLLDRNGNYVERYPIRLRDKATNGIVLFDYDNKKEYRIMIACKDRKVYVYDLEGNIVPGWTFRKSEGIILKPVQHFRIKERDYIVFSDDIRAYILDRRGKERVKQERLVVVSKNNLFYLDMNIAENNPRLITTDTSGNVIGIDLNGKIQVIFKNEMSSNHFFQLRDLDNDGRAEFIFTDKNELKVFNSKGKRLSSFKIKSDISTLPDIYQFSTTDLKIGITDTGQNEIYLLNSDGSVYEGFPLEGNTRYSIGYFAGSDSRFNLIVGSENGFLYNYSIE